MENIDKINVTEGNIDDITSQEFTLEFNNRLNEIFAGE